MGMDNYLFVAQSVKISWLITSSCFGILKWRAKDNSQTVLDLLMAPSNYYLITSSDVETLSMRAKDSNQA